MQPILHYLVASQFISGGIFLMLFGGFLLSLKNLPLSILDGVKDRILYTVRINSSDSAFTWVRAWISAHGKTRYVTAGITHPERETYSPGRADRPRFYLCPRGLCILRFKGRRLLAWISQEDVMGNIAPRETITLRCFGGDKGFFESLLNEAYDHAQRINGETVEVWIPDGTGWQLADRKAARHLQTMALAAGIKEQLIDDARAFGARREWYLSNGIPFRRGYLLHGPPGNGKSSLAHVLASELRTNVSIANLSTFSDDSQMMSCLSRIPRGHVVLLEDVDTIFEGRQAKGGVKITFSALLNAIDGVCAQEGRILIMTTNRLGVLDSALIRAGRADVHVFVGNATREQAAQMFLKFFPSADYAAADAFAGSVEGREISMAAIQERLLSSPDAKTAAEAIAWLPSAAAIAA